MNNINASDKIMIKTEKREIKEIFT